MFKTTKAKIIFVLLFSILCIITTSLLIVYQNIDIEEKSEESGQETSKENIEKDFSGIDLKGRYNQNDLIIEEKSITLKKIEIRNIQIKE